MSFKKRNADPRSKLPPGSRLSAYNGQLLISTGVPTLDDILGGGLPVGTILLIKEDRATQYAHLLLKYFFAQGMASQHELLAASCNENPNDILRHLMWLATSNTAHDDDESSTTKQDDNDRLTIAWRYAHLKKVGTPVKSRTEPPRQSTDQEPSQQGEKKTAEVVFCNQFDLTQRVPENVVENTRKTTLDKAELGADPYRNLLERIRRVVVDHHYSAALPAPPTTERGILRIGIQSLASPDWYGQSEHDMYKFLHGLRGLLRFSFASAVVTLPSYLYDDTPHIISRLESVADCVIAIESFAGSPVHNNAPYTQNYHGFFHVQKVPALNSLVPPSAKLSVLSGGGCNDLGFKLRRKRFTVETFHLPPEGGVGARRTEPTSSKDKGNGEEKEAATRKKTFGGRASSQAGPKRAPTGCGSLSNQQDPLSF